MPSLRNLLVIGAVACCVLLVDATVDAHPNQWPLQRARNYNWHQNYAHSSYGQPVSIVVPPTSNLQTNWGWGVGSSRISRIDHQFGRDYPGAGPFGGGGYNATPVWPQDTNQFGVYHVRAPW